MCLKPWDQMLPEEGVEERMASTGSRSGERGRGICREKARMLRHTYSLGRERRGRRKCTFDGVFVKLRRRNLSRACGVLRINKIFSSILFCLMFRRQKTVLTVFLTYSVFSCLHLSSRI